MKNNYLPHLAARVFGVPLLISRQKLSVILQAIGPRLGLPDGSFGSFGLSDQVFLVQPTLAMPTDDEMDPMMAERDRKPYMVTPDGIAVIGIDGTLVKKASWIDAESGLQSYQSIRSDFRDAVADPRIKGVLLDVDSPGGEVGGLFELADEVYAARSVKPCYAIANDEAFSAAYALASSAERLFVTRTGGVGSIGVIAVHLDQSSFDEKLGRKYTAVFAGARKNDFSTHEPLSEDARAILQIEIDRIYDIFVGAVARNRQMKAALVRNTDAGLFYAEQAVSAGLADQVGTFDEALAAVFDAAQARRQARVAASAEAHIPEGEDTTMSKKVEEQPADAKADQAAAPAETKPAAEVPVAPAAAAPAPAQEPAPVQEAAAPAAPAPDAAAIEANVQSRYEEIAALCTLSGEPDFLAEAIKNKMTVAQARDALLARKAAKSQGTAVQTHQQAVTSGAEAQLKSVAEQIAATNKIPFAQAYVQAVTQNSKLYEQYLAERSATVKPN